MYDGLDDHLLLWEKHGWAPPYRMHICLTDHCNLECLACWRFAPEHRNNLSYPRNETSDIRLLKLIDEAVGLGVKEIELTGGGEPFVRRNLARELMKRIKEAGLRGTITTNGTLLSYDDIRLMVDLGWDEVIISLDGPTAEINDKLRPPKGSFNKTLETITSFKKYKLESGKDNYYQRSFQGQRFFRGRNDLSRD